MIYGAYDEVVPADQATPLDAAMRSLHRTPVMIIHQGDHLDGLSSQIFTHALKFIGAVPPLPPAAREAESPG